MILFKWLKKNVPQCCWIIDQIFIMRNQRSSFSTLVLFAILTLLMTYSTVFLRKTVAQDKMTVLPITEYLQARELSFNVVFSPVVARYIQVYQDRQYR